MSHIGHIVKAQPFTFNDCSYDVDADVLYLSIGKPREGTHLGPSPEGHLVRLDPETGELAGVTILHASHKLGAGGTVVSIPDGAYPRTDTAIVGSRRSIRIAEQALSSCCR